MNSENPKLDCRAVDLTGKKFHNLKVLNFSHSKPRGRDSGGNSLYWLCQCRCGNKTIVRSSHLKSGGAKSCGKRGCVHNYSGCNLFCGAWLTKATKHGTNYLTNKNIIDIYEAQNGLCYHSGDELVFPKTSIELDSSKSWNASIDRINNNDKIYSYSNVNITTGTINRIRWDNTIDEFYRLCADIYKYRVNNIYIKPVDIVIHKFRGRFNGYKNISGSLWTRIQYNAQKRNIKFNLDIKNVWDLYVKQGGLCAISGRPITFTNILNDAGKLLTTASLDRIDSDRDYIIDNVQWVHKKINEMKMSNTVETFIKEITKVVKHKKLV